MTKEVAEQNLKYRRENYQSKALNTGERSSRSKSDTGERDEAEQNLKYGRGK